MAAFNYTSAIKNIQNRLVASTIRQTSNLELLRSEEAIRDLIRSYTDKFRAAEGMLTDISKYIAQSQTVIRVEDLNQLFSSLYIDLSSLYGDLETVDRVLTLNLARNKNYFAVLKKRLRELWQRLRLTRLNVYDLNPADESFYETFYSNINIANSSSIVIDKKLGFVTLEPTYSRTRNQAFEVKKVSTQVYPVENEEGGVLVTTSFLNNLSGNYSNAGTHDMLENGLWKEELVCSDVPDMIVNVGSSTNPIHNSYRGVVAIVDIEYVYPVELNRIDFDIFGDKSLLIDGVLYKTDSNAEWLPAESEVQDYQTENSLGVSDINTLQYQAIRGEGFDILTFPNVNPVNVKVLRIIFNQKNYSFVNSPDTQSISVDQQINKDLSERRYELLKFNANLEEELTAPVNEENKSIYSKVISAVESTRNIADILTKILDVLVPELKVSTIDFGGTAKFELGTWSIEPKYEEYSPSIGKFETKEFPIRDRHLIGASLTTSQSTPGASTINWFVSVKGKNIPIVESDKNLRKEPINPFSVSSYPKFQGWPGSFCLLDLPINPIDAFRMSIYQDGILNESISEKVVFLNTRLLYFHRVADFTTDKYVIKYPVALYNCCNMYVLQPLTGKNVDNSLTLGICSTRREILERFIETATYEEGNESKLLSENYTITNTLCAVDEAADWFTEDFNTCIFIDQALSSKIGGYTGTIFESLVTTDITKYSTTLTDISDYLSGFGVGSSALDIVGSTKNIVPISLQRTI